MMCKNLVNKWAYYTPWDLIKYAHNDGVSDLTYLPFSPPGWRGIVITVRAGGRAAAKLAEPISL